MKINRKLRIKVAKKQLEYYQKWYNRISPFESNMQKFIEEDGLDYWRDKLEELIHGVVKG